MSEQNKDKDGDNGNTTNAADQASSTTPAATPPADSTAQPAAATTNTAATSDNPVKAKLAGLGVEDAVIDKIINELGATTVEDLNQLNESDLIGAGMKLVPARNLAGSLSASNPASGMLVNPMAAYDILPKPSDDASWLNALKVGGILKFNKDTVSGTVSAALADKVGLYDLPDKIVKEMEANAESLDEPVGAEFFEMQRSLTQRNYGDIFAALPGVNGQYATKGRKAELLRKMNENLWPSLAAFQDSLSGWMDAWQATTSNPMAMMQALTMMAAGGRTGLPPGTMAPPPIDNLRDSAEGVINSINRIFAGTGIPVAMALAFDAQQIRNTLDNPNLPAQVGALNRDQMLKKFGAAVSSDYPRLEMSLKRYTLSVIELPNVSAGQTEIDYVIALFQLGSQIQWSTLGVRIGAHAGQPTGIGGNRL